MQFKDICRLCLIKSSKSSEEIFFPIDEAFEIKFDEITNTKIHKNENYPNKVCISCLSEFEKHHSYRNGLIDKQKRLNQLLGVSDECVKKIEQDPKEDEEIIQHQFYEVDNEEYMLEEATNSSEIDLVCEESVEEVISYEEEEDGEVYQDEESSEKFEVTEYIEKLDDDDDSHSVVEVDEKYYMFRLKDESETENNFSVVEEIGVEEEEVPSGAKQKRKYVKQDTHKKFKCWMPECNSTFAFRATMRKHLLTHGIECDKSTCLICGQRFDIYSDFLSHVKIHTRKSECDVCKLRFVSDEKMQAHRARVHANDCDDRCFRCEFCHATFKRREHVNAHILYKHTTSDESTRRFHCKECPTSFLTRQDLKNHEKSHRQVMIDCCYCDYKCRDLKSIRRHCSKLHNTNKIYKCKCLEYFEAFRELQVHKKSCCGAVDSTTDT